jgi:5-methylcytosine-specific restriction endonuclease McrA
VSNSFDNQVLVLNRLWQPVNVCSARRAIGLLFLGHAQVVGTFEDNLFSTHNFESWARLEDGPEGWPVVHTVSDWFWLPTIIVLTVFDRFPRKEIKFSRENVFQRDDHVCQYCGKRFENRELNLDHVIPRDKGGVTSWENIVCSCIRCNTKKGNKLPSEARMAPIKKPVAPRWRPLISLQREVHKGYHESWRLFLEPSASSVTLSA